MNLSGILSIAGHPGLFKMVSQMKGGLVVESLNDGKRMPAYTSQKILALDDISIYTQGDDVPLKQVYASIIEKTGGKPVADPKKASNDELRELLASVLPTFDRERVYTSDIKKLFQWFNILAEKGLAVKDEAKEETASEEKKSAKAAKSDDAVAKTTAPKTQTPKAKVPTAKAKATVSTQRKSGKV